MSAYRRRAVVEPDIVPAAPRPSWTSVFRKIGFRMGLNITLVLTYTVCVILSDTIGTRLLYLFCAAAWGTVMVHDAVVLRRERRRNDAKIDKQFDKVQQRIDELRVAVRATRNKKTEELSVAVRTIRNKKEK